MAEIDEVFVLPESAIRGIGRAARDARPNATWRRAACVRLQLQLGVDNDRARRFYERHGFRRRAGYELLDKALTGPLLESETGVSNAAAWTDDGSAAADIRHHRACGGAIRRYAGIVSRETHGPVFRYSFAECAARARRLANALRGLGLDAGAAVGSIAWNNHRHLEAYYAVSGSGLVMHTCNPRLHPDQLIYIINHAEDRVMLFDATFAALVKAIAPHCPKVEAWVCLSDAANMRPGARELPNLRLLRGVDRLAAASASTGRNSMNAAPPPCATPPAPPAIPRAPCIRIDRWC